MRLSHFTIVSSKSQQVFERNLENKSDFSHDHRERQNKNAACDRQRIYQPRESDGPLNLIGTEASGTSVHMAGSSIDNGLDPLDIGLPGTVGTSVGVGNLNTKGYALATKITLRHSLHLPSEQFVIVIAPNSNA